MSPFEKIISLLNQNNIEYQLVEHEPVFTSEQAAAVRGFSLKQGAKALLLKVDGQEFLMVVIPGDKRLETKKLKKLLKAKDIRFATPEEVVEVVGCKIGAVYPFGVVAGVRMLVDQTLAENEEIGFNPGVHDKSIKMKWQDYYRLLEPELIDIVIY